MRRNILSMMNMKKLFNISPLSIGDGFTTGLKTDSALKRPCRKYLEYVRVRENVVMLTKDRPDI